MPNPNLAVQDDEAGLVERYAREVVAVTKGPDRTDRVVAATGLIAFITDHHGLIDRIARDTSVARSIIDRGPWLTIKGGAYKSKDELMKAVTDGGHKFSDSARKFILSDVWTLLNAPVLIDVYKTNMVELTRQIMASTADLTTMRDRLGFGVAPDELALLLCLGGLDTAVLAHYLILSEPKPGHNKVKSFLGVSVFGHGVEIRLEEVKPDHYWHDNTCLLVCMIRPQILSN